MKTFAFWVATLAIFGVTNGMIARKEAAIRTGLTMYLELAPRDPRSLMQGDYMVLNHEIEREPLPGRGDARRGRLVVRLDESGVARFVRIHRGEPLAPDEHLLRFRWRNGLRVGANSFFFQEGHGARYANARYGEYKVAETGESVLVGLRNADLSLAGPPPGGQ
ncbi:MAG: GDYXXLXY domain-containing protein [Planctomycetes bacterium]|nr:GDYXXLXY domain-containing protein [Planctomycetota bacterium]